MADAVPRDGVAQSTATSRSPRRGKTLAMLRLNDIAPLGPLTDIDPIRRQRRVAPTSSIPMELAWNVGCCWSCAQRPLRQAAFKTCRMASSKRWRSCAPGHMSSCRSTSDRWGD